MKRVVVTGMGLVTPLGHEVEEFWRRLKQGDSGISHIEAFDTSAYKSDFAGVVREFDAEGRWGRKEARRMDRFCQFAVAAAEDALLHSGIRLNQMDCERLGVYVGSGIGGIHTLLENAALLRERGPIGISNSFGFGGHNAVIAIKRYEP
jgi:3-oxoacyl-[acyl-carrier-protein] synthase II